MTRALLLITLLTPDVALSIPVDQRAGCLALAHEKRVATKLRDTCSTSYSVLGVTASARSSSALPSVKMSRSADIPRRC